MAQRVHKLKYIIILSICLLFVGCSTKLSLEDTIEKSKHIDNKGNETRHSQIIESPNKKSLEKSIQEITISAVGDILIHDRVYNDALIEKNRYDFTPMLAPVKKYLNDTTITFANQETMIGGTEIGLSTYPMFNSPKEVGEALKDAGVNIVSLANNHTLDRGEEAIQSAIRHWNDMDMMYVGAYKDKEDQRALRVMETDEGISVAFLASTYGTNGIPVPKGKDYLVNLIDKEKIASEIEAAKEVADATIISLHFGNEYERMPSEDQKELVQFVADQGADVVLGTHPHVLQPIEWITGKDGNETLVAYSLGNFLSGQKGLYRQIGGVLKFKIMKANFAGKEKISIELPAFMPTYNASENETNYRVLPMHETTENILPDVREHEKQIKNHMSQWLPELEFIK